MILNLICMSKKKGYPRRVTEDNVDKLIERAEKIGEKQQQGWLFLPLLVFYVIPSLVTGFASFFSMFWLLQNHYLDFLLLLPIDLAVKMFWVLQLLFVGVVTLPIIVLLLFSTIWLMQRHLGYPTDEELIFADCFIMAKNLRKNERLKAKNQVNSFLRGLKGFVRHLIFNPRRKIYSPEFDTLRTGKNEICRMLMFSKEEKISELLMNFGLAFVRNDDPEAFSMLQQFVDEVKKYGEPKGTFRRFLSGVEQYPHASPLILTIMIVVVAILYYCLSGQQLPIG